MKKSEFKKILRPIVNECIKESLMEDGLISGIIAEVVKWAHVGTNSYGPGSRYYKTLWLRREKLECPYDQR